jgi:MtN3 and saliva related transmembrane protein
LTATPDRFLDGIGYLAAFCTTIAFVPQLIRVLQLKSARDVSLSMVIIFTFGVAAWLVYGLMLHSWPVIVANAVTLVLSTSLLGLKLYYSGRDGS